MPTREWNAATSCGIAAIWMRRAITPPISPPIRMATPISGSDRTPGLASVVTMAMAMPVMP